jgi:hypothetical protein
MRDLPLSKRPKKGNPSSQPLGIGGMSAQYEDRITADPKVLGGKPVIGTRIAVGLVLQELA